MFQILYPRSWDEARELALKLKNGWVFRGHANASWRLETTLERAAKSWRWYVDKRERERAFLWHFKGQAHQYLENPPQDDHLLDWLSVLQHFGGPTRLLDFTYSFYVAVFFAVENAISDSAVWALNLHIVEEEIENLNGANVLKDEVDMWLRHISLAEHLINNQAKPPQPGVVNVIPAWLNKRMLAQQGCFLFPFNLEYSFEGNLAKTLGIKLASYEEQLKETASPPREYHEISPRAALIKMILPLGDADVHNVIWQDLRSMNVTAASLFPDLSGLARSFHHRVEKETAPTIKPLRGSI